MEAVLLPLLDDTAGDLGGGAARAAQPGSEASDDEGEEEGGASTGAASEGGGEVPELGRQRLGQLLGLLGAVLEPEELGWLAATCCAVRGRVAGAGPGYASCRPANLLARCPNAAHNPCPELH